MTCGIYAIVNSTNDKVYIGKSINIEKRWSYHKCVLRYKYHRNKHLENDYYEYGKDSFNFIILHECNEDELSYYEMEYILRYESTNPEKGYNKTFGGDNEIPTEENRKKKSEARKGVYTDEKHGYAKKLYVYNTLNNEVKIYNCKKYLAQEFYEKGYTKSLGVARNYLSINRTDTKVNTKIPFHEYVIFSTQELLNEYLK